MAKSETSASETSAPETSVAVAEAPDPHLIETLSDGTKVKRRVARQRACNNPGKNNNICRGHLKRWSEFGEEVRRKYGPDPEIYRCERCHTLYLPNEQEEPALEHWLFEGELPAPVQLGTRPGSTLTED